MARNQPNPSEAAATMHRLLAGGHIAHVIRTAAKLGLADHLEDDKPLDVQSIAKATSTHAPSLARVMRALAAIGIVHETKDHQYRLTPLGATLRTNAPGSMRAWALLLADDIVEQPWRALSHAVLTGELAFCHVFGSDIWTYLSGNPTSSDLFDGAMQSMTQGVNASLVSCYPFGNFKWIVEVGGGIGSLLVPILAQNPEMRGTIVELPQVAEEARKRLSAAGLASRCEVVAGDALVAVPTGADAYVLKHVIHDFEDDKAAVFLRNCRSAIQGEGKVIIIDRLLPDQADPGDARALGNFLLDIMMMLLPGGKERTEKEFRDLFAMAGLRLNRTIATPGPPSIIETVPV